MLDQPDDQDLKVPVALLDHMQILREILQVYTSSFMGSESIEEKREGFRSILDLIVDSGISMCTSVSDSRHAQKPSWDKDVFMLNCLEYVSVSAFPSLFQVSGEILSLPRRAGCNSSS